MGIFKKLFSREVTLGELKRSLAELERHRRRRQLEIKRLSDKRADVLARLRRARAENQSLEVDYLWEELKLLKSETTMAYREARIAGLETVGIKRFVRSMERLEKQKDDRGARALLERMRASGLDDKLAAQDIREEEYLRELQGVLEEGEALTAGVDGDAGEPGEDDREKLAFLRELDAINEAEAAGATERAAEEEARLKKRLDRQAEEG